MKQLSKPISESGYAKKVIVGVLASFILMLQSQVFAEAKDVGVRAYEEKVLQARPLVLSLQ